MDLGAFMQIIASRETALNFLMENGLLPAKGSKKCAFCKKPMHYDSHGWGRFRCRRRAHLALGSVSTRSSEGTWFEGSKIRAEYAVLLMYAFANGWTNHHVQNNLTLDAPSVSCETISDWYRQCREVCLYALQLLYQPRRQIGGPNRVVHADEVVMAPLKYNCCQFRTGRLLFVLIDSNADVKLEVCHAAALHERATIWHFLRKHLKRGTVLVTKKLPVYEGIEALGFVHETVDDALWDLADTWPQYRQDLEAHGPCNDLSLRLADYLWRRVVRRRNLDPFQQLLKAIRTAFPIHSDDLNGGDGDGDGDIEIQIEIQIDVDKDKHKNKDKNKNKNKDQNKDQNKDKESNDELDVEYSTLL